jgi:hypothetical protein
MTKELSPELVEYLTIQFLWTPVPVIENGKVSYVYMPPKDEE